MGEMAANGMADAFPGAAGRTPAEIERDLAISTLVDLRLLHAGRAASLFRAHQIPTRRTVAVKVLHDELSSDVGQRFDRERAITGQLSGHTGIVPLFDTGTTADGEPFLVMPYYRRGSLADLMTRYGPLGWQEASFLLEPVAVTLAEVHGRDLVHRNLKPGNILLTDFLLPRVADFGMCLPKGQTSTPATVVESSSYSPPETAEPGESDPAIDVFGLGATLWGLLAGQKPPAVVHNRRAPAIVPESLAHNPPGRSVPAPPPEATPLSIADLIERSMAPDAGDRPPNAAAFVTDLRRAVSLAGQSAGSGRSTSPTETDLIERLDDEPVAGTAVPPGTDSGTKPDAASAESDIFSEPVMAINEAGELSIHGGLTNDDAPAGGPEVRHQAQARNQDAAGLQSEPRLANERRSAIGDDELDTDLGRSNDPSSAEESAEPKKASSELYLLVLVALISTGILVMLAAAVLAVN